MLSKKLSWADIAARNIHNRRILLDIDGVLMAHGEHSVRDAIVPIVQKLNEHNEIFIVSNSLREKRIRETSKTLGIPYAPTKKKKPNPRILNAVSFTTHDPLIVIGDKYFTDGLFAHFIGAEFLFMERLTSPHDSWTMRINYLFEDAFYKAVRLLYAR